MADEDVLKDRWIRLQRGRVPESVVYALEGWLVRRIGWLDNLSERVLRAMNITSFAMLACVVAFYGFGNLNRSDPYIIEPAENNLTVEQGGYLRIPLDIQADITRNCSRATSRWVIYSDGLIYMLPFDAAAKPADNGDRQRRYQATRVYEVPENAARGKAAYISKSQYVCNPAQIYWPIEVTEVVEFTVL